MLTEANSICIILKNQKIWIAMLLAKLFSRKSVLICVGYERILQIQMAQMSPNPPDPLPHLLQKSAISQPHLKKKVSSDQQLPQSIQMTHSHPYSSVISAWTQRKNLLSASAGIYTAGLAFICGCSSRGIHLSALFAKVVSRQSL